MRAHLRTRPRGPPAGRQNVRTAGRKYITGTLGASEGARRETSSAHTPGISMSTIFPRFAAAIADAGIRHAAVGALPSAHPAGGVVVLAFLLAIVFLIVVIRINAELVSFVMQLLQLVAAVGFALVVAVAVGVLFVVLILHG
jgi:hypothetical protein